MIKNFEQALKVQKKRYKSKKKGISKAVRTWLKCTQEVFDNSTSYQKLCSFANFDGCAINRSARKIVLENTLEWVEPKDTFYYMSHEGKRRGKTK